MASQLKSRGVEGLIMESEFTRRLRNTQMRQDGFAVAFSGVMKSGKSTVAKVLEHRYNMVRVENDMIRESSVDLEQGEVYYVVADLIRSWDFENRRVVLDGSIDRSHDRVLPALEQHGFPTFIVEMPVPDDINERFRLHYPDSNPESYVRDQQEALEKLDTDFVFGEDGGILELLQVLDSRVT